MGMVESVKRAIRIFVGSGLVLVGCGPDLVPQLKAKAASDFGCPETQVKNEGLNAYMDKVEGCQRENMYAYDHGAKKWVSPLDRAPFDLSCDTKQLSTKVLGTNTVGVEGCGKKATYILTMRGWVLNTETQ